MTGADTATKITVLKHFIAGRDKGFIADAVGMSEDAVMSIATKHGYPRPESMERAITILEKEADQLPQATMSGPAPARTTVPPRGSTTMPGAATHATPVSQPDEIRVLINTAKGHPAKAIQRQGDRVLDATDRLRSMIREDQEKNAEKRRAAKEREDAKAEVERLKKQLEEAKAKLRPQKQASVSSNGTGDAAKIRAWARENNIDVPTRGQIPHEVRQAYELATAP